MKFTLIWLAAVSFIELLMYVRPIWGGRKAVAWTVIVGLCFSVGLVLKLAAPVDSVFYVTITIYRLINLFRIVKGQTTAPRLYQAARQTFVWLAVMQIVLVALMYDFRQHHLHVATMTALDVVTLVILLIAIVLAYTTARSLKRMHPPEVKEDLASEKLPTLTVAIPARNETDDLEACLQSLIASTYPKLEIIVLDDCSQEKRTPEIIRNFASGGVRFIAGEAPAEHWLAKNFAYQQLLKASNGELVLYCGVDARFEPATLTQIVENILAAKLELVSFMPINLVPANRLQAFLIQPIRYAWEIAVPRRWSSRPPLLSTCWIARRKFLEKAGSFSAVTSSILPERYFARKAQSHNGYRFYLTPVWLGLRTVKAASEQRDTALRMRYPQLHRRIELVLCLSLIELLLLGWPAGIFIYGILSHHSLFIVLGVINLLLLGLNYVWLTQVTYRHRQLAAILLLPLALFYDVVLLNISMYRYEFSEVYWKGRNICIPLMQVMPGLPKLR